MNRLEVPDNVAIQFFKSELDGIEMSGVHAARCPICGDSEKHKQRKRLYLLKDDKGWGLYCHNCAFSSTFLKFVKEFYPLRYPAISTECMNSFFFDKPKKKKKEQNLDGLDDLIGKVMGKRREGEKPSFYPAEQYIKENCMALTENCGDVALQREVDRMRNVLFDRKIKRELIEKMFYAYDGDWKQRVLIPFFDESDRIYYFQAMATQDWQKKYKYLNFKHESIKDKPRYNEKLVDRDRTVYIAEGLFDSTFVDNAIATTGAGISTKQIRQMKKDYPHRIWIMDNDETGLRVTKKLFEAGEKCVLFKRKWKNIKDLNDLVLHLGLEDLTEIMKDLTYNNIEGLIELNGS